MAIWDNAPRKDAPASETGVRPEKAPLDPAPAPEARRPVARSGAGSESVIAAGITIDGKIEGSGHVRVAGNFKGDIHVEGDLTIESGAKVTGSVRAETVTIGGELNGNIEAASRVDLRETGVLTGDLKAGSLTVAAGSRMRGQAEFGWDEKATGKVQAPRDSFAVA
ncbi:MAG TPA: polymer-forming cytoskeletal protein [Gemmatimonadales bacterium]|nr:polymer-forming cytoskeletal protein [Gemmatimonadales bacterium]